MQIAKPRRYGAWAGNPAGRAEDPTKCIHALFDRYHPGGYQCTRKRGHGPEGLHCKQHDPVAVKAKSDAKWAAYNAKWDERKAGEAARELRSRFAAVAETALRQIAEGHNDPRALASEVLAMLSAAGETR